jgi:acetyl-CoA C-acetyltransferase
MSYKTYPIIIGVAQYTQPKDIPQPLDPLNLMIKTCQMALVDTGNDDIKEYIDSLYMVNINTWSYKDAPSELSKMLGIDPAQKVYLPDGGDSPQMLVNRAAKAIASGQSRAIIITGGEAAYSVYREKKGNITLNWPKRKKPKYIEEKSQSYTTNFENKYGMIYPSCTYAMFETAVRASSGRSVKQHREYMGRLFEHYSKIASKNPFAWSQKSYTAEEIFTPSSKNRYVIHPYTKRMCSNMYVDQSASLIMTNEKIAQTLNIDQKHWIYPMGGADLKNIFNITNRPKLYDSPATREGSRLVLKQAGLKLEDIDLFDIYSCFPSMAQIIMNEIGLSIDDPRDFTITGGLPYFGGPMSNYAMHAIVTAVDLIRKNPSKKIMIIANGGYNTKQSFGVYGIQPPVIPWNERNDSEIQQSIFSKSLADPIEEANSQITIEAYTIYYNRNGIPKRIIVLGYLENGRRTLALIEGKPELLFKLEQQELVGKIFPVHHDSARGHNLITIGD